MAKLSLPDDDDVARVVSNEVGMKRGSTGVRFLSRFSFFSGLLLTLVLQFGSACGRPVASTCSDSSDCGAGSSCSAGLCVEGVSCVMDLDCDLSKGELCQGSVCVVGTPDPDPNENNNSGGPCSATAECPATEFCNTATGNCVLLLEDWCRLGSQCPNETPFCNNRAGPEFPGRCVECLEVSDCGGAACTSGVCDAPVCPPNASEVVGGSCRCDVGFIDDAAGNCVPAAAEGEGEGEGEGEASACRSTSDCVAALNANWACDTGAGQCICDESFVDVLCNGNYDLQACDCTTTTAAATSNQECFSDSDCDGLRCVFSIPSSGLSDPGYCKESCSSDADCSGSLTCMPDLFADGSGFCANVGLKGESCEASVYRYDISTNDLCDANATGILDCFSSRCEEVCDWTNKSGPPDACLSGSCGALTFRAEVGSEIAVCR